MVTRRAARKDPASGGGNADQHSDNGPPDSHSSSRLRGPATDIRVIYVDIDDDLPEVLDRLEEAPDPAIIVLPDGAHAIRGMVSARLLARRATAKSIAIAAVAADRTVVAQLEGAGIEVAATVGEARSLLVHAAIDLTSPHPAVAPLTSPAVVTIGETDFGEDEDEPLDAGIPTVATRAVGRQDGNVEQQGDIVQDAAPTVPVPSRRHLAGKPRGGRKWAMLAGILLLLAAIGAAGWIVFFPAATVSIVYGPRTFARTYKIGLDAGATNYVPVRHAHILQTQSVTVMGTGVTLVADGHAVGSVTFANQLNGVVIVPAGTILDASSGAQYATDSEVSVPGAIHSFAGTSNGQASVRIHAVNGGVNSNAPAGSITTIEGRLAGALLVTNYQPLTGGSMRSIYSLTRADLLAPTARLRSAVARAVVARLDRLYAKSPMRWLTKQQTLPTIVEKFNANGRPAARITVEVRADLAYVHMSDIVSVAKRLQRADLADKNQVVTPGSVSIHVSSSMPHASRTVKVMITARTSPAIDAANLRALLTGMSVGDARRLLDGSAKNGGWSYTLNIRPDWAARLPIAEKLISISIRKVG